MTRPIPKRRRPKNGVLVILIGMFLTSAVFRFASGPAPAMAEAASHADLVEIAEPVMSTGECLDEASAQALLGALSERENRLTERENALTDRAQALSVAETMVSQRLEELRTAQASLSETLAIAQTAAEADLGTLTSVYENMKPRDAAALFAQMPADFAAGFLGRMRPEPAAAIMAGLEPETAFAISVALAGRNARAPLN